MKRIFVVLSCLLVILAIHAERYVVTASNSLNVRAAADKSAAAIGKVYSGDTLEVKSVDGEWAAIAYNGAEGYVSSSYIRKVEVVHKPVQIEAEEISDLLTKIAYGVIVVFSVLCYYYKVVCQEDGVTGENLKLTIIFYLLLTLSFVLSYFFFNIENVVDGYWTGGWSNGYWLAFINSCVLALATIQIFRTYKTIGHGIAWRYAGLDEEQQRDLQVTSYLFFAPLMVVWFLFWYECSIPLYSILIPLIPLVVVTYKNFKLLKSNRWLPIVIMLLGFYSCFVMGVAICIFIKVLVLGIVKVLMLGVMTIILLKFIFSASEMKDTQPEGTGYSQMGTNQLETNQEETYQEEDGFDHVLEDFWGSKIKTKDYDFFGDIQVDKWGTKYDKQDDGTFKERI